MSEHGQQESFLTAHFTLRHRAIAALSRMFDNVTYRARHGLIAGKRRKGGLGWLPSWLPGIPALTREQEFLQEQNYAGKVVYDVGGFQGLLTLFFSGRAKHVVVYEPVPANRARLLENLALNGIGNVTVRDAAVGAEAGQLRLTLDPRMMAAGSADSHIASQITSSTSAFRVVEVPVVTLDDDIASRGLPSPDFVKIDVEGLELAVLQGMRATVTSRHPQIFIEMHGATREDKERNAKAVVSELWAQGYRTITHVESGAELTPLSAALAASGHIAAS